MPKILFCGKGGSGKSTLLALTALFLAETRDVLVIDSDESNAGLARMMGLNPPELTLMDFLGGKAEFRKAMGPKAGVAATPLIPAEYLSFESLPEPCVSRRGRLKLAAIGKVEQAHEGCACPMGVLARDVLRRFEAGAALWVLIDAEAGLEHFGRGLLETVDHLVAVSDPSFDGLSLVSKIRVMAEEEGKTVQVVLNRTEPHTEPIMREELEKRGIRASAAFRSSAGVAEANLRGLPVPLALFRDGLAALLAHFPR